MIAKANNTAFETCPEYIGQAICVDCTPLKKRVGQFGETEEFRFVFEIGGPDKREDGTPFCVWSRGFTLSLHEKANLRKFIRGWIGRDLTEKELKEGFDTEIMVGRPAMLVVVHEHKDSETYANIMACTPDKSATPLVESGTYVRAQDRPPRDGQPTAPGAGGASSGGGYRRAEAMPTTTADPGEIKIHVGRHIGIQARDLPLDQIQAIADKWLPGAKANPKPTADDKRLITYLDTWLADQQQKAAAVAAAAPAPAPAEDDVPY